MIDLEPFITLLTSIGPSGMLAVMLWLVLTGKLVPKGQYDDVKDQRDRLLALTLENTRIANDATARALSVAAGGAPSGGER
jgi:hypothetical protein